VSHPEEQRVLERIQALRAGGAGARVIARKLNTEGLDNPRSPDKPWTPTNVGTLLRTMDRRAEALGETG